jgi:hypothetical protein
MRLMHLVLPMLHDPHDWHDPITSNRSMTPLLLHDHAVGQDRAFVPASSPRMTDHTALPQPCPSSPQTQHAGDRIEERLHLPRVLADFIQIKMDDIWNSYGPRHIVTGDRYHWPLLDKNSKPLGYAAFQRVGKVPKRGRLVLTTVLSPSMKPNGINVGSLLNNRTKGLIIPDAEARPTTQQ